MTPTSTRGAVAPIPISSDSKPVRIGVTGHRKLNHPDRILQALDKVMTRLDELFTGDHRYEVISALAEGADRLVARFILEWKVRGCDQKNCQPVLNVLLPMPEHVFFETFDNATRDAAVSAYKTLRSSAENVSVEPAAPTENAVEQKTFYENSTNRHEAYLKNGHVLAERSQILIAVWNGQKAAGKGGTAEIVSYARSRGFSVIHIHSETGNIYWPRHADDYLSQIQNLEEYNNEAVGRESVAQKVDERFARLIKLAQVAGLSHHSLIPLVGGIIPHWEKATRLAAHNRMLYLWTGTVGYILSACAVGVAATLSLMVHEHEHLFAIEAAIIIVVAFIGYSLKHRGWQRKWIDYRYLAERLRAACFLYVAGLPLHPPNPFPDHKLPWLPDGWISIAQKELWQTAQPVPAAANVTFKNEPPQQTRGLGHFLLDGWIVSQQKYYARASHQNHFRNEISEIFLYVFLAATLAIAIGHAGWGKALKDHGISPIMSILAVTLPACAAAVAGITVHWHFHRNYERYASMSHFIGQIAAEVHLAAGISPGTTPDPDLLRTRLREADRAMSHEHEGWRTVFGVRLPGPG